MRTPPPEFAVAGLEPSVQLYQLTMQVKRLRGTVQRLWIWVGVLSVLAGLAAAYDHWIPSPELLGRSLVLTDAGARTYTLQPRVEGLGIRVSEGGAARVADVVLRTENARIWIESGGKTVWQQP